jgi:hypothetical protein
MQQKIKEKTLVSKIKRRNRDKDWVSTKSLSTAVLWNSPAARNCTKPKDGWLFFMQHTVGNSSLL